MQTKDSAKLQRILPIASLLLGSGFLLFAGGVNALILPLRGTSEGFSSLSLGLLGTGYAGGYILGCLYVPRLVARVGHIRSFSVMASIAGLAILSSLLLINAPVWIALRALSGFCFAGGAMIVEGWLSERSDASSRGTVFGTYTMVNLFATTAGQMSLATGDPNGYLFFVIAAMFYMLAVIPTAVSSSASPNPLVKTRLNLAKLYQNSPVAVVAVFLVGVSNSAFGTLAAVYAQRVGFELTSVALFASLPILAGALIQVPVGLLSDRMDRRAVLVVMAIVAISADFVFIFDRPDDIRAVMVAVAILGAAIFSMYPIIIAHANDHADPEDYTLTSGGLLLIFGVGAVVGPLVAGIAMDAIGDRGLFMTTAVGHFVMICYALWRMTQRSALPTDEKGVFVPAPMARTTTPQTAELAPHPEGS